MADTVSDKKSLRKEMIRRRDSISADRRSQAEDALIKELCCFALYTESDNILLYASCNSELETFELIEKCISDKKCVYLPKVSGRDIIFYKIASISELVDGYKSIKEPAGDTEAFDREASSASLLIMPGVAFDPDGYRLGYGGGFYDRFLSENVILQERSIAIGYKEQDTGSVPHDERDIKPGRIMLF